jgi:hypothetical protein
MYLLVLMTLHIRTKGAKWHKADSAYRSQEIRVFFAACHQRLLFQTCTFQHVDEMVSEEVAFDAPVFPKGEPGSHSTVPCIPKWMTASASKSFCSHL